MIKTLLYLAVFLIPTVSFTNKKADTGLYTNRIADADIIHDLETIEEEVPRTLSDAFIAQIMEDTLVAMDAYDHLKDHSSIYERYGYHFWGHCYSCDAVDLYITDSFVRLTGIYTKYVNREFVCNVIFTDSLNIISIEHTSEHVISVKTKNATFIFEQIENAPVYKLTIKGDLKLREELTIYQYYSPRRELHKFSTSECPDFEG